MLDKCLITELHVQQMLVCLFIKMAGMGLGASPCQSSTLSLSGPSLVVVFVTSGMFACCLVLLRWPCPQGDTIFMETPTVR